MPGAGHRIEHAGRDRHAEGVVDEREEQVLAETAVGYVEALRDYWLSTSRRIAAHARAGQILCTAHVAAAAADLPDGATWHSGRFDSRTSPSR
jgi:hypothetical protein